MSENHFQMQIARIERQFGKYGTERASLLWRDVKEFSDNWFTKTVDKLLAQCRQIPIPSDFYDEMARERERLYKIEKDERNETVAAYEADNFGDEEKKWMYQNIREMFMGKYSDEDAKKQIKVYENASMGGRDINSRQKILAEQLEIIKKQNAG